MAISHCCLTDNKYKAPYKLERSSFQLLFTLKRSKTLTKSDTFKTLSKVKPFTKASL